MTETVRQRHETPTEFTWDVASMFPSDQAWDEEYERIADLLAPLEDFRGHLGDSAGLLADWFEKQEVLGLEIGKLYVYSSMNYDVNTNDQDARARSDRFGSLFARTQAATAFAEPEMLAIGFTTLRRWVEEEPRLAVYTHYFDQLERRQAHIRSAEVEEVLGLVQEAFRSAVETHGILGDTDLVFEPARGESDESIELVQGNLNLLLRHPDREVRRTAWENYADAHLAVKNTMASCLATGVKQHVFDARVRKYESSLQASLDQNCVPLSVYYNLIDTYQNHLSVWHRYWKVVREGLGYDRLHVYDIKAPLTGLSPDVPYSHSIDLICEGMAPLGDEYVRAMRRGLTEERWVDVYPNLGKRSGAYSTGWKGTHPFILMSYDDNVFGMSTLAHELGHSMHSYFTNESQPLPYSQYSLFVAEVASNFNQALVRAHLLRTNSDPDFQIAMIEEAMSNFHRYFFIMPILAQLELEIHERVERGEALTADTLVALTADLFRAGYGDEIEFDRERIGITWAEFSSHMYGNFYVYQYATGIAAANALAQRVLDEGQPAAEAYLSFLRAGGSVYPLDALTMAGVDMTTPAPVEQAFGVMSSMVDRLGELLRQRAPVTA